MGNNISEQNPDILLHTMMYCGWEERETVRSLSKQFSKFTGSENFFNWCCERLALDHGVYVPPQYNGSRKELFQDLFPLRTMWSGDEEATAEITQTKRFKINVFARFRPSNRVLKKSVKDKTPLGATIIADEAKPEPENSIEVNLPLHQRLAMIKMSHRITSNKAALKILASEGGWFHKKWSGITVVSKDPRVVDENEDPSNTPVFHANTEKEKTVASIQSVDPDTNRVVMIAPDVGLREFVFNGVLPQTSTQANLYNLVSKRLVADFLNGYNATTVVYGQTGSGKSFSMFGDSESSICGGSDRLRGLVPRACAEILQALSSRQDQFGITSQLNVTYVEIYGDFVSDLLRNGARVGQSKVASHRYVLSGAAEHPLTSMEDLNNVLKIGEAQKRRAATAMNDRSSRAHVIFILSLTQTKTIYEASPASASASASAADPFTMASASASASASATGATPKLITRTSKLFLADLGGSEQVKKSQVDAGGYRQGLGEPYSVGFEMADNMREAVYINLGLLALKKVIEAINNKASHVPYHDSKLTMLLSEGLGGDCKTSIVVCANMDAEHATETVSALRFGERCALIELEARNKANMLAGVLANLDARIADMEAQIKAKERWGLREETRTDELAEEGTVEAAVRVEIKKVYMPVGAEAERQELERLLRQRAKFTGSAFDATDDSESSSASATDTGGLPGSSNRRPKGVVGFGRQYAEMYGLGERYDSESDLQSENVRFAESVSMEQLPSVVRSKKGARQWTTATELAETDQALLEAKAKKVNRTKLVYAGLS